MVVSHEAQRVIPVLEELDVSWVQNEHYDRGMFSSIQTGVRHLLGRCAAFFVHPDTIKSLIALFETSDVVICGPCYKERYGHPPLISMSLACAICEFDGEGGMRALLARSAKKSRNVFCNDPGVLMDIDTPEDYERTFKTFSG